MFSSYRTIDIIKTIKTPSAKYNIIPQPFAKAYGKTNVILFVSQIKQIHEFTTKKDWLTVGQFQFSDIASAETWVKTQGVFEKKVNWWVE